MDESNEQMHNAYLKTKELYTQTFGYEWPEVIWAKSQYNFFNEEWFSVNLIGLVHLLSNNLGL